LLRAAPSILYAPPLEEPHALSPTRCIINRQIHDRRYHRAQRVTKRSLLFFFVAIAAYREQKKYHLGKNLRLHKFNRFPLASSSDICLGF
ncbi:hypothetical protein BC940DRAFT_368523, partial [Gongronella butleri]